ncbi:hypothetical protein M199_gp247 [Halogranum tailed virus 1]|uniref:Helix-hairpin-helix DNA-binding motif class 1 domain-containing protein n=1 Tax=Halogranum tailed virus 1 TaxID=1273749 RepID=R4T6V7_9CAUD|nr:hypothetical protein M199_gp247 [Halogranum tailed virus 1]AGM11419.1 hypothetical protein HGTV1_121 [Halogranum tailed virus 1]
MTVVSYRIYCDECDRDTVIRKDHVEEHLWKVNSLHQHSGLCPSCNDMVDETAEDFDDSDFEVQFEDLKGIGAGTASNLREAGYETRGDVRSASDEELSSVPGVGKTSLTSLRKAV